MMMVGLNNVGRLVKHQRNLNGSPLTNFATNRLQHLNTRYYFSFQRDVTLHYNISERLLCLIRPSSRKCRR